MVKEIPLTRGMVALVDDADYEFLTQFTWGVIETDGRFYARRGLVIDGDWFHIPMHRLLTGAPVGVDVDHWNGNGLDNRRENIRLCSHRQNMANKKQRPGRAFKGVYKARWGCYTTSIRGGNNALYLGSYDTAAEAARVYDAAARRVYGEFALGNFPDIDPAADEIAASVLAGGSPPDRSHKKSSRRLVTDDQVLAIRQRYASGECDQAQLATLYGLKRAAISHIITGRTFKNVGGMVAAERREELHRLHCIGKANPRAALTAEQVLEIRRRYVPRVVGARELAEEFNVSVPCIYSVVNGHTWKNLVSA